jgi:ABC-type uncharacterized transport system permease subunit
VLTVRVLGVPAAALLGSLVPGACVAAAVTGTGLLTALWWGETRWSAVVACALACVLVGASVAWLTARTELAGVLRLVRGEGRGRSRRAPTAVVAVDAP